MPVACVVAMTTLPNNDLPGTEGFSTGSVIGIGLAGDRCLKVSTSLRTAELRQLPEGVQRDPRDWITLMSICVAVISHHGSAVPVEACKTMSMRSHLLIFYQWLCGPMVAYILTDHRKDTIVSARCPALRVERCTM